MNYSFHPDAEKELEEAENYYDSIREELAIDFALRLKRQSRESSTFQTPGQRLSQTTRRRALKTFLYGIVYRVKTDEIRILAVMHLHREPDYWVYRK
jgi:plasmid stabilization system protein ParE